MRVQATVPFPAACPSRAPQAAPDLAENAPRDTVALCSRSDAASSQASLGPMESLPYSRPYTGKGVGIAILDTGVAPHPDLEGRLVAFKDMVGGSRRPVDPVGHGTHCAGDAAGSGRMSDGRFAGAAPEADIIGIRVLDGGEGETIEQAVRGIIDGLEWMVDNKERYNIRVANLSLGIPLSEFEGERPSRGASDVFDPLKEAVNSAVKAGIVVVVAAGNDGDRGEGSIINTPATNPNVITVGAVDAKGTPRRGDDIVADFSSRGPTPEGLHKPDVVAPGANIMSLNAPGSEIEQMNLEQEEELRRIATLSDAELEEEAVTYVFSGILPEDALTHSPAALRDALAEALAPKESAVPMGDSTAYLAMDGTSMASPIVAGICASMIEANPSLTPEQVKEILVKTARPLAGFDRREQGAGLVDPQAAVALAEKMRAFPAERHEVAGRRVG